MLLGLGRGPPGRGPPGLGASPPDPGRPAGRGPPGPVGAPGAAVPGPAWLPACGARGVAPIPVAVELNGLLPGRGPGLGACRCPGEGGADGRGPAAAGRGVAGLAASPPADGPGWVCSGRGPLGRGWAGGACGGAPPSVGNGTVTAGPGRCAAGGSGSVTGGVAGWTGGACGSMLAARPFSADGARASCAWPAWPLAARLAAAGAFWPAPSPPALAAWLANSSLSLRTTGASIVEDADLTNSPISWSLAMTALLSTPNSFASS
jgi:hypothetical protein